MRVSKLVKIAASVRDKHTRVLVPNAEHVPVNFQRTFGFAGDYRGHKHISLGDFYEYMSRGLWGGNCRIDFY